MTPTHALPFATRDALNAWLREHHATADELWVRLFKKGSGQPSVAWEDLVVAGLTWGWIDGQRRALDAESFVQRLTPRRARSTWSKKNCELAERLIAEGVMEPAGRRQVDAARADGRWDRAYAGSADMEMPPDLEQALDASPGARAAFDALRRAEVFSIYFGIQNAKKPETRARRIAQAVADLTQRAAAGPIDGASETDADAG